ncbi:MAG: hypothetical protein ABFS38_00960 [Bacteroidota bacterium]
MKGLLDNTWKARFDGMEISHKGNDTILLVNIKDEAFLHGILNLIRDLNLTLISINPSNNKYL